MSETACIHDAEDNHIGNICRPGPLYYRVATHRKGARKWEGTGTEHNTIAGAFNEIGQILGDNRRASWPEINRAGIWAYERGISYYDPRQVYEVNVT